MATWKEKLDAALEQVNEQYGFKDKIIKCTLSKKKLVVEFDDGYGGEEGEPFTAWSENFVFFPVCYDGSEWVGHAPRNPCEISMFHQGGG